MKRLSPRRAEAIALAAATEARQAVTDTAQSGATAQQQGAYAMSRITEALALAASGAPNAYPTRAEVPAAAGTYLVLSEGTLVRRSAQGGALTDLFSFGRPHAAVSALAGTLPTGRDVPWRTATAGALTTLALPNPYPDPGNADMVHPSVVHVPQGWNGWRYWMAVTPYNQTNNQFENPCILVSNSPEGPWVVPAGLTNPVFPAPGSGFYSDPDLFIDPADNQMVLVWRGSGTPDRTGPGFDTFYWSKSADGVTWTPKVMFANPDVRVVSPSFVYRGDHWLMLATETPDSGVHTTFVTRAARWQDLFTTPRTPITPQAAPDGTRIWHANMEAIGDKLVMIASTNGSGGGPLWLAESTDPTGVNWTWAPAPLIPSGGYRSQVLAVDTPDGPRLDVWAGNIAGGWRVRYARSVPFGRSDVAGVQAQASSNTVSLRQMGLAPTLVYDSFARPDGAMDAPDVGNNWADIAGGAPTAYTRVGGRIRAAAAANSRIVQDAGRADVRVSVTVNRDAGTNSDQYWLMLRVQDVNNFLRFGSAGGTLWKFQKVVAGTASDIATLNPANTTGNRVMTATLSGTTVTLTVDGTQVWTGAVTEFATATKFGLQTNLANVTFDDFLVESLDGSGSAFPRRVGLPDPTARTSAGAAQSTADQAVTWASLERAEKGRNPFTSGDGFDRADASTLGAAPYGGAWSDVTAGWGVSGRQAVSAAANARAVLTLPSANQRVEVTVQNVGNAWLMLRVQDSANYLRFGTGTAGGALTLQVIAAAGISATPITTTTALAAGQRWRVDCSGDTITAYVNGVQVGQTTVPTYNTQTRFGIQGNAGATFDDWVSRPS